MTFRGACAVWLAAASAACSCSTVKLPDNIQARLDSAVNGGVIALPEGVWSGQLTIRKPLTLRGAGVGQTIILGTLIIQSPGVRVESLTIHGTNNALRIGAGAELLSEGVEVACDGGDGAAVEIGHGTWRAVGVNVSGACRRGIAAKNGTVDLKQVTVRKARETGIHAIDSAVTMDSVHVTELSRGATGFFAAHSHLHVAGLNVDTGEEGVLLRYCDGSIDSSAVSRSSYVGIGAVGGTPSITNSRFTGPFREAGISVLGGAKMTIAHTAFSTPGFVGVMAVLSSVTVEDSQVEGAVRDQDGDFGHGFYLERSKGTFLNVKVSRGEGAAIYVSGVGSDAQVDGCVADSVASGITTTLNGTATVRGLHVTNAPVGILAAGHSQSSIGDSDLHSLVGMLACVGSTVTEGARVVVESGVRSHSCEDDSMEKAWRDIISAP